MLRTSTRAAAGSTTCSSRRRTEGETTGEGSGEIRPRHLTAELSPTASVRGLCGRRRRLPSRLRAGWPRTDRCRRMAARTETPRPFATASSVRPWAIRRSISVSWPLTAWSSRSSGGCGGSTGRSALPSSPVAVMLIARQWFGRRDGSVASVISATIRPWCPRRRPPGRTVRCSRFSLEHCRAACVRSGSSLRVRCWLGTRVWSAGSGRSQPRRVGRQSVVDCGTCSSGSGAMTRGGDTGSPPIRWGPPLEALRSVAVAVAVAVRRRWNMGSPARSQRVVLR